MSLNASEKLMEQKTANQVNETDMSPIIRNPLFFGEDVCLLEGEQAIPVNQLPLSWQSINAGKSNTKLSDPEAYVKMAQLFLHKMSRSDVDLFNDSEKFRHHKSAFCEILGNLAWETLEFYGKDFDVNKYPNFGLIEKELSLGLM